jgi:hypothetical protein
MKIYPLCKKTKDYEEFMNPINNVIFIKKIIEYSLFLKADKTPKEGQHLNHILLAKKLGMDVPEEEYFFFSSKINKIPKQLELYFEVNDEWADTVINYLDHVWNLKDISYNNDETVWAYAVKTIESIKFWKVIAQKDNHWFYNSWVDGYRTNHTIWHYATCIHSKIPEIFWDIIVQKDDNFFENQKWNLGYGFSVWFYAIRWLQSDKFWENIIQRDDSFFQPWSQKNYYGITTWENIINTKSQPKKFWELISEKPSKWYQKQGWYNENKEGFTIWQCIEKNMNQCKIKEKILKKEDMKLYM